MSRPNAYRNQKLPNISDDNDDELRIARRNVAILEMDRRIRLLRQQRREVQQKVQKIGDDLNAALEEEETLSNMIKTQVKELLALQAERDREEDVDDVVPRTRRQGSFKEEDDSESSSPTSRDTSPEEICLSCVKFGLECEVREGCKACVACNRTHRACVWEDGSEVRAQSKRTRVGVRKRKGKELEGEDEENGQVKKRRKLDHRRNVDFLASLKQAAEEIKKARDNIDGQNAKQRGDAMLKLKADTARLDSLLERFKGQLTAGKRGAKK